MPKPYYEHAGITIYHGDCREILPDLPTGHLVIADPPYGETQLEWDRWPSDWVRAIRADSMWMFGTMRMFFLHAAEIFEQGFGLSQDLVWEKQNGSGFHTDRFRRVHENVLHFYRGPWNEVFKCAQTTPDATARQVRKKARPAHWHGETGSTIYVSHDGGPRMMRSVIYERNCHGSAENETQKPFGILRPLVEYGCPPHGVILDPFCGSGSALLVARETGRTGIGIELREDQCEIAAKRLSQEVFDFNDVSVHGQSAGAPSSPDPTSSHPAAPSET